MKTPFDSGVGGASPAPTPLYWYGLPHGYFPIDLTPSSDHMEAVARQIQEMGDEAGIRASKMFRMFSGVINLMNTQGVVGCAIGFHPDEYGEFKLSILTFASTSMEGANPKAALAGILRDPGSSGPDSTVEPVDLPCGPGVMIASTQRSRAPGHASDEEGEQTKGLVWTGTVVVPDARNSSVVTIQLATAAVDHADDYRSVLLAVAHSVSFKDPEAADTPTSAPEAGATQSIADEVRSVFG